MSCNIFVCYDEENNEAVDQAVDSLTDQGAAVFKQRDASDSKLAIALRGADRIALFWSRAASKSWRVEREWRKALDLDKPVIVVRLDETPLDSGLSDQKSLSLSRGSPKAKRSKDGPVKPLIVILASLAVIAAVITFVPSTKMVSETAADVSLVGRALPIAIVVSLLMGLWGGWLMRRNKQNSPEEPAATHGESLASQILG